MGIKRPWESCDNILKKLFLDRNYRFEKIDAMGPSITTSFRKLGTVDFDKVAHL